MSVDAFIYIRTRFEAEHRWKDAPDDVAFLRNWHRHMFHVELGLPVADLNRELEFFRLKRALDRYIHESFAGLRFEHSCEQIAKHILTKFVAAWCDVSEDGENGARLFANPEMLALVYHNASS